MRKLLNQLFRLMISRRTLPKGHIRAEGEVDRWERCAYDLYVICMALAYMYSALKSLAIFKLKISLKVFFLLFSIQAYPFTSATALCECYTVKRRNHDKSAGKAIGTVRVTRKSVLGH